MFKHEAMVTCTGIPIRPESWASGSIASTIRTGQYWYT